MGAIKLLRAKLKNFYKFTDFVCEFGDRVTHFVGANGSGKSTVAYKGLLACLNGISEQKGGLVGKRFLFIGKNGKSADMEYTFKDAESGAEFTLSRHVTPSGQDLKFKSASPDQIDDSWLRSFLNVAMMSAKNFCALSQRDQALALGIDTSSFQKNIAELKQEYSIINREIKNMGEPVASPKVDRIDLSELLSKKEKIRKDLNDKYVENKTHNAALRKKYEAAKEERERSVDLCEKERAAAIDRISTAERIREELEEIKYPNVADFDKWAKSLSVPEETNIPEIPEPKYIEELPSDEPLREIDLAIASASETNRKADQYGEFLKTVAAKDAKIKELAGNKAKQEQEEKEMVKYISSFDFPFAGLSTDENGGLVLNDRPINESYFSRGELEIIVAQLHASMNPNFKCRFIDDFDLIDDDNQEKILKTLLDKGFQVITAEVRKTKERENTLVLRECSIVDETEIGKEKLL
jgi:hypothetical protein